MFFQLLRGVQFVEDCHTVVVVLLEGALRLLLNHVPLLGVATLTEDGAFYFLGVGQKIANLLLAQILPLPELVLQVCRNFLNLNILAVGIQLLENSHGVGDDGNVQRFLNELVL